MLPSFGVLQGNFGDGGVRAGRPGELADAAILERESANAEQHLRAFLIFNYLNQSFHVPGIENERIDVRFLVILVRDNFKLRHSVPPSMNQQCSTL